MKTLTTIVALLFASSISAQTVLLPIGTSVYVELGQQVTSKKKSFGEGQIVQARVWRNVVIDGKVVIKAGAPMVARISRLKKAGVAGRKGQLEIEAVSLRAVDHSDVLLDGGYDKSGKSMVGLSVALFAVVAWPLIFLKGKQAVLEPGTIFDCSVQEDTYITLEGSSPVRINLGRHEGLDAEVLIDEIDPDGKQKNLPLQLKLCGDSLDEVSVVTVNDKSIDAIPVILSELANEGDCVTARGEIDLKRLSKLFTKGINRFEIEGAGKRAEIILDVEL